MQKWMNIALSAVIVFSAFLIWNLEPDPTQPNVQFLPEMHYSIPFNPQSANPLMPDGKTLQEPPAGTIPRGMLPLRYTADERDRQRAGRELVNPVDPDSLAAFERGTKVYATFCSPCHGSRGEGDGMITRHGFPPPPSFGSPTVQGLRDGEIFHTLTFGKGNMPPMASQIRVDDRWNVILKVRSLQENLRTDAVSVVGTGAAR